MATFVVAHGAWSAGWAWRKMHPLMTERGHRLITPTMTGLGERSHLAAPAIDLDTHIADIVNVLQYEELERVHLIGHSYGGMVATGVADRARGRIAKLIYIDAFAPRDGESAFDIMPASTRAQRASGRLVGPESWRIPPGTMPPDTSPDDVAWCTPKRTPHPLEDLRAENPSERRLHRRAALHLLRRLHAGRSLPAVLRARAAREMGGRACDRLDPQSAYHGAGRRLADLLDRIAKA